MADLLERVDVAVSEGDEQVDAVLGRGGRDEDHQPLDGQVRRQERARRPSAQVHLVELDGPAPAVHRHPHLGELLRPELPHRRDLLPHVCKEALERAAPSADARFELSDDEIVREVHVEAGDLVHGHYGGAAAVTIPSLELDGTVIEHRRRSAAGHGGRRAVEEGRRMSLHGEILARAHRACPRREEGAQGVAVGNVVMGDGADQEAAALVAVELDLKQSRPNVLL